MNLRSLTVIFLLFVLVPNGANALPIYSWTQTAQRDYNNDNIPEEIADYARDYVINQVDFDSKVFVELNLDYFNGTFDQAFLKFRVDNYQYLDIPPYFDNHLQLYSYFGADGEITAEDWSAPKTRIGDLIRIAPYIAPIWGFESFDIEINISRVLRTAIENGDSFLGIIVENPIEIPFPNFSGLVTVNNFSVFERVSVPTPNTMSILLVALLGLVAARVQNFSKR